jgi:twinfilin-like protein
LVVTDDSHNGATKKFAFILFVPDNAKVRSKMLYASSSSLLQRQLGGASNFTKQIYWTEVEEVSGKGWKEHLAHEKLDAPLTREEQSLQDVREKEADQMLGTNARRSHVVAGSSIHAVNTRDGNLPIQLSEKAKLALEELGQGPGAVGLQIDSKGETLVLTETSRVGELVDKHELVKTVIDSVNPQYTVFKESSDGNAIFIYTCPTASKVKERMVYAVNRKPASNIVSSTGIKIEKEVEGSSGADIIDEIVFGAAAVASHAVPTKARFSRPKPPGRK